MSAVKPERTGEAQSSEELELWRRAEESGDPELRGAPYLAADVACEAPSGPVRVSGSPQSWHSPSGMRILG